MAEQKSPSIVIKHQDADGKMWAIGLQWSRRMSFNDLEGCVLLLAANVITGDIELEFSLGAQRTPLRSQAELDAISDDQLTAQGNCIYVNAKAA